jgi:hypothetical protein
MQVQIELKQGERMKIRERIVRISHLNLKFWIRQKPKQAQEQQSQERRRRPTRLEVSIAMTSALMQFICYPHDDDSPAMLAIKQELQESFLTYLNNLETINKDGIAVFNKELGLYIWFD